MSDAEPGGEDVLKKSGLPEKHQTNHILFFSFFF